MTALEKRKQVQTLLGTKPDGAIGPVTDAAYARLKAAPAASQWPPQEQPEPPTPPPGKWRVAASLGATGAQGLLGEINAKFPGRDKSEDGAIGDAQHSARTSDHNPCDCHRVVCARDFTHDPGTFDAHAFAEWLRKRVAAGVETRVKYVISRGRIASGPGQGKPLGVWRPYTGSNPHDQHIHVSVRHGPELFDDASPWGVAGGA